MATRNESPTVNGYSIKGLKMYDTRRGVMVEATLLKDGKVLGEYFNPGDGSDYDFAPTPGITRTAIGEDLARWTPIPGDSGFPAVYWNIGILVEHLAFLLEIKKCLIRALKRENGLIVMKLGGRDVSCEFPLWAPMDKIRAEFVKKHGEKTKYSIFRSLDELNETVSIAREDA